MIQFQINGEVFDAKDVVIPATHAFDGETLWFWPKGDHAQDRKGRGDRVVQSNGNDGTSRRKRS